MELYTFEQVKDKVVGKRGTKRRDDLERELSNFRIGLQIREARKAKHITQQQLAERIGKERSFISKIETDGKNITIGTLYDIVERGLGCKLTVSVTE